MTAVNRLLLPFALLLTCAAHAHATWTLVQHPNNTACSGTSCAVTVASTGSGHLIVAVALPSSQATISSVSGGGTYTHCSGCAASLAPQAGCTNGCGVDASYTLSSASGATSITITLTATGNSWASEILEYSYTSGPASFDTSGTRTQTTNVTNPAGVGLTLTGSNDVIVQAVYWSATASGISSPYSNPADFPSGDGVAGAINTTSGTAPTWTATSGKGAFFGLAFTEASGAAAPHQLTTAGVGSLAMTPPRAGRGPARRGTTCSRFRPARR